MPQKPGPKIGSELSDRPDRHVLVEELQLSARSSARKPRAVLSQRMPVSVRPADSNRRSETSASGVTRELRSRALLLELNQPLLVGSFYQIRFEDENSSIPASLARCDQVTMQSEVQFEARLQFLEPIHLAPPSE